MNNTCPSCGGYLPAGMAVCSGCPADYQPEPPRPPTRRRGATFGRDRDEVPAPDPPTEPEVIVVDEGEET